jgi:hypothetical protein
MKIFFLLLPLAFTAMAQGPLELTEEELNPSAEDILIRQPEKLLRHESMIYDLDSKLGIKDQRQYTGNDSNRFSFAAHIAADYEHPREVLGGEVTYMRRTTGYSQFWWGGQFFRHLAHFDHITQNHSWGGANSEASSPRPGNVQNTVIGFGPGMGYRFKLLLDFFPTENVFESVDVFLNVIRLNDSFVKQAYTGYGLTANYGIHKRSSTSFFYGGKLSYNVAGVTRGAIGTESQRERSFSLGWPSLAFELGFFY